MKETDKFTDSNLMEGMVSVRAGLEGMAGGTNDRRITELFYAEDRTKSHAKELAWLSHRAQEYGFPIHICPAAEIDALCIGNTHGGVLARCTARSIPTLTESTPLPPNGFCVMLEGIEDPYNFGYAMRSLYASGADAVILSPRNWMTAAGIVCRASAGASERFPMYVSESGANAADIFRAAGYKIICADIADSVPMYDADLSRPVFLIVGGERRGISRAVLKKADAVVRLDYGRPFDGALSAASAASILAFEIYRQNRSSTQE